MPSHDPFHEFEILVIRGTIAAVTACTAASFLDQELLERATRITHPGWAFIAAVVAFVGVLVARGSRFPR
jgi:hypothetical protein